MPVLIVVWNDKCLCMEEWPRIDLAVAAGDASGLMSEEDLLLYRRCGLTTAALGETRLMLLCFGWGSLGGIERCLSSTSPVDSMEPMPASMGGEGRGVG